MLLIALRQSKLHCKLADIKAHSSASTSCRSCAVAGATATTNICCIPDITNVVASQQVAGVADHSMQAVCSATVGSLSWPCLPRALPLPAKQQSLSSLQNKYPATKGIPSSTQRQLIWHL